MESTRMAWTLPQPWYREIRTPRPDRIHPVKVVVIVKIGLGRKLQFLPPPFNEPVPEEVADGHAVRFLVA
jgi:hypothetical protein